MWVLASGALTLAGIAILALLMALLVGLRAARRVKGIVTRTDPPLLGARPGARALDDAADLRTYPNRLAGIEEKLVERHRAVQEQLRILQDRRAEVSAKGDREDLDRKYADDIERLDRRGAHMRRVMALVWKTRSILLLRVHLAVTARRRPTIGKLPEPGSPPPDLRSASATCHEAAAAVKFYVEMIEERTRAVEHAVPPQPVSAEVDDILAAMVNAERVATAAAHVDLREKMDRLADNLTWLGDHFASLRIVSTTDDAPAADGDASHLLEEVAAALAGLHAVAGKVDHAVADEAVAGLTEDVGQLEEAGLEAEAAAAAQLEVDRLVGGFGR